MDDLNTSLDPDELMDLEEVEASDIDEDEEDNIIDDPLPSPLHLPSSGPASAATSAASSPPTNDDTPPIFFTGKPLSIKRGRGRPRREGGKPSQRRSTGTRLKKWKPPGYSRGSVKRVRGFDRGDIDFSMLTQSPGEEMILDPETGALILTERTDKPTPPIMEELPYAPENWPGKVCGFCNLGERSQLGQGEMLRLMCPEGFTPERITSEQPTVLPAISYLPDSIGDKSPRGPVTCRRQKSFNKCRNPSMTSEYIDELTIIGHTEEPEIQNLFEATGHFYVHRSCAYWANGVVKLEHMGLDNVGPALLLSSSRKCNFCNHYGASISCKMDGCSKIYHLPCATASGSFQELNSRILYCSQHLSEVGQHCESSTCYTCKNLGDVANLMYCSLCGEHYHGTCVGLAQLPGVRAGWQCRKCRICQTCRMIGDESKLMTCEQCDKVYHAICQRPVVTTIPKYGWKCRCCRVCGDCGSRTPGAGLSSRWHAHYTVCDSCYQQRNKGYNCPLCHRAYRAHAHREMVQCTMCRKFVHGTCDPAADLITYHERKQSQPDYEYVCLTCKNISHQGRQMVSKRNSIDEDSLSASQESLYDDISEFEMPYGAEESMRSMGLGKGKPYTCKIAKKRLGYGNNFPGRPKGVGKGIPGKVGFMKKQKMSDFGRKRGPKYKMRGVFGVPGVGLQRPTSDGGKDEEPGIENRLVLCSAKDKYVLTQDICVMCGAIGTDQEGCLISCVQCGQCYHPYCVNVKVTKVILQKGWRCLDCTVCEGCGHRDDESRLILCDDCDISYHIYCMDPPLHYVPHGNWKCKWCAMCQLCGATDPGFNCNWMNSFAECGPCASHSACASCSEAYNEGDLIIQCVQCERWLHGACDSIKTDADAEKCAEDGYNCILCRPRDVLPPHLLPTPTVKPPTPTKSPEIKSNTHYYLDGVFLSEAGHNHIKTLCTEQVITRKKRKKLGNVAHDKEAGIMATIESVIAGSAAIDNSLEDAKLELVDVKDEPQELYKEGMTWNKEDGPPPEGFTIFTTESGLSVLRRKRQRNLQKLGIGGFLVRVRGRGGQDNDEVDMLPGQTTPTDPLGPPALLTDGDKPRRKPMRRKPKSKLSETFPAYLQEAFFGKELLDCHKDFASSSSEDEHGGGEKSKTIHLSQDEIKAVAAVTAKQERLVPPHPDLHKNNVEKPPINSAPLVPKEEDESDTEALKDVLTLPGDFLDPDLVNTIMNDDNDDLTKNDNLESLGDDADMSDPLIASNASKDTKDELSDILGSHFNLDIPMVCKDVEDIFKGVLTDESQESQESNIFPITSSNVFTNTTVQQPSVQQHPVPAPVRPSTLPAVANQNNLNSPMSFPPQSPYHSEYSNSPQFSPAFSGPPSPWVNVNEQTELDSTAAVVPSTYNQRSSEKMKADEGLGPRATISAVLYANINHPEWKTEFPAWSDRYKQIIKKWRTLSNEQKAPYLQQAKDNRSALRMKKQQQISKESSASPHGGTVSKAASAPSPVQSAPPPPQPVSEVCTTQQSRPLTTTTSTTTTSSVLPPQHNQRPASITPPSRPASVPPIQHQFTVHGPVPGPGDLCHGPAPNVTVNPLYAENPPTPRHIPPLPPTTDHQIRVLTPSEIMRTLPSLCQETCESPDQEKIAQQQKTAREQEQERQWKQLQALRQQQAQQQQHVIQEQRVQGMGSIVRVQRQLSENGQPFMQEQLQVASPAQEGNLHAVESAFSQPSPISVPVQPKQLPVDPYAHQPSTPRPNIVGSRPTLQGFPQRPGEPPEVHRQLRDLLQRQQFKKLDEQLLPGKGQQRVWPPSDNSNQDQESQQVITPTTSSDTTFRHPLPPGIIRQRLPGPTGTAVLRQSIGGLRMQLDPRLQGMDPRMRLILQQQQQRGMLPAALQQQFQQQQQQFPQTRFVAPPQQQQQQQPPQPQPQQQQQIRPTNTEIDQLLQRNNVQFQQRQDQKLPIVQSHQAMIQQAASNQQASQESGEQEIPDNFTAELEKLEQEGSMVELQGVGDILGGLGDDDDELLAEMGAGFNILKYADPELDDLTSGEKGNILDSLDLVDEPDKEDKKDTKVGILHKIPSSVHSSIQDSLPPTTSLTNETPTIKQQTVTATAQSNLQPPPLVVTQSQSINQPQPAGLHPPQAQQLTPQQQIHQQMLQQVQQVAAMGRPMPPGTRLMSQDGIIGTVTSNNNVSLTFPPNYGRVMHVPPNQKMQMRLGGLAGNPKLTAAGILHSNPQRMPVSGPPPPPPPYPGPPPPYPGSSNQQMGPLRLPPGLVRPFPLMQRRPPPLLLEEQPLLLEDLLEQEKREQEKQLQTQTPSSGSETSSVNTGPSNLLSEHDFERLLKSEIMSNSSSLVSSNSSQVQGVLPIVQQRASFVPQSPQTNPGPPQWQQARPQSTPTPTPQAPPQEIRVPTFQANLQPTPPLPPDQIITEQDKQAQMVYEQWLNHQNNILGQQLKFYETEVQKLRKIRKSLNSKQRQLRKSGNQLGEADAHELQKISAENNILQKHLESSRKQSRQHGMLIQDYRNKQQAKQGQMMSQPSPLGPPASSPIHPPQSPMMSPSASPMMQHSSPLHSPAPSVSHSPGPGSVSSVLQSPSNPMNQVMSPMQPSPRIGTPHSQSEGSPGPVQSPSMHLPPPMRMTSPQHRRVVTSPIGYTGDLRPGTPQARFARPPLERNRLQSPSPNFSTKPGTPSPLNSPPPQPINQQLLQRHLQQHTFSQQASEGGEGLLNSQRTLQLIHQRQYVLRHQQQQAANQPLPLTPQQHQLMVHQQQQLAKQQQQQIAQLQAQQRLLQNQPPHSPMPPQSPIVNQPQIMSPLSLQQNQPPSPMPPRSPMINFSNQPPNSPMPRSPAVHQNHPPSSPMIPQSPSSMPKSPMIAPNQSPLSMRRPPSTSNSPAMPDRPTSVENPRTPYANPESTIHDNDQSGGGNPHNPNNPIPYPPGFGRFGYFKLGLRGGAPMWGGFGRGAKRIPENKDDKAEATTAPPKFKKESHLSKVSILKKKSPAKINLMPRLGSLVSSDYNELDDSSSTPPVTPPPMASTSRVHKSIGKNALHELEQKEQVLLIESTTSGKQIQVDQIMDYDDDNDAGVVSAEVSLNSAAQQNDSDEIAVTEIFTHSLDALSSPLESDQIPEDFVLFDIADAQYSDKEEEDYDKDMQIVNVAIQSPTTSEEEMIMQGKTGTASSDGSALNLVQGLSSDHLLAVSDNPDSPDQEEMHVEPADSADEDQIEGSQIVIIDTKPQGEEISTKEDFEELIDEGKIIKPDTKHISEIHKYAQNVFNLPPKTSSANVIQNVVNLKGVPPKVTLITAPFMNNLNKGNVSKDILFSTPQGKNNTSVASIILPIKTTSVPARHSLIGLPKFVSSSPAITIVSASTSQIASILPSRFTVPVISASAVSKLPNVKVIDKPSSSLSLTAHQDTCLPKKIFEDDSVSPDSSNNEDDKKDDVLELKKEDCKMGSEMKQESLEQNKDNKQSMVIHSTPELKMTAQVVQESQGGVQIARSVETMPFIMTQSMDTGDLHSGDDTKSVVISIPSPTPSQEQMLDNIALQALENRRRDGNGIPGGFDSLEDVLDMIENITGEPSSSLDDIKPEPLKEIPTTEPIVAPVTIESPVTVSTSSRPTVMPQLSPLSQPTELTTNIANMSQQIRTLLSNLHTTTVTTSTNVETSVKSVTREKPIATLTSTPSVVSSRIIQNQERSSPISTSSTVIVPNLKKVLCSPNRVQSPVSSTVTIGNNSHPTLSSLLPGKSPLMPDHPKLPPVTTVATSNVPSSLHSSLNRNSIQKVISYSHMQRKPSLSLNAMLQSHPAATVPQTSPGTITTASILGSPIAITRPSLASLAQAQPHVISPLTTTNAIIANSSIVTPMIQSQPVASAFARATTNLLHTQLTKSPMIRPKTQDDEKKEFEIKKEPPEMISNDSITSSTLLKQEMPKYLNLQSSNRTEDSQNVLLKQLLQNTACATSQNTSTSVSSPITTTPTQTAPSLPIVPNLEAQLARPVPPTPSSLLPPILQSDTPITQPNKVQRMTVMSRETSFVSKPPPVQAQQLHIDIKKGLPPSRTPSRDDLLSPATPRSSCSQESSLQTPPLIIKKEPPPQPSPILTPHEVKKEFMDESSQHSEVSDHSKGEVQMKEEIDGLDQDKILLEKEEMKKLKRRAYQQKRRQNQILNKEIAGQPKKRPRKSSKVDEDYDSYIESVLAQLRALPAMIVSEPSLNKNFSVVPVFGSGDLSKLGTKEYDARCGDLLGSYGNAIVPGFADFYNSKPYGDQEPLPEKQPASTQRGFYDQEFPLIRFDSDEDKKFDLFSREDSPDSIISSSSPECPISDSPVKFPGLKLIDEDEDEEDTSSVVNMRLSPIVPLIAPIPIRLKPAGPYLKDFADVDKENICSPDYINMKSKFSPIPTTPLKDSGNVTVTLTLTSSAAEDIMGVLRDLANILHIPAPTSYQIVERTSTPPSQKLGLYRTKGKDGKEGAPIDIQSILNGAAKFCRHCDVVILNHMIRKKVSELPFLSKDSELLSEGDELYFCGSNCYMQFALMHRSPSLSENKAAEIIDHLSQDHRRKSIFDKSNHQDRRLSEIERMDIDMPMKHEIKAERYSLDDQMKVEEPVRNWKNIRYKSFLPNCIQLANKYKKPTDKELMELMYRLRVTVMPQKIPEDTRKCMFCRGVSDSMADGPARLLNFDVDKWVHLNCGLWSDGVYETVNGALMNLSNALQQSLVSTCVLCNQFGATIRCFKTRCSNIYHLPCAVKDKCVFYKNKTTYCSIHVPKNEKDNELTTLSVSRRVYVERDENRQVAAVMHHSDQNNLLRVGSLIFLSVGQLLPHQLANFHTANFIYPIGYKIVRFYWSMRRLNKRCRYVCSIHEVGGRPEFRIMVQENGDEELELRDCSCKGVWMKVLEPLANLRRENQCIHLFPQFVSGEDLFGLTEPAVVRVLESLPGIETLTNYKFKYGRNPLLELPLAINPTGAARTEAKLRNQLHWKRPHTQRTGSSARPVFAPASAPTSGEAACPYSKQFVHSKSSQYKKMKQEWRNNVYLARSKIQGLGLYAARDLEKHTMVIEYIGEIIRAELAETRERKYEAKNRGIYMFRLDEERVVDATLSGGLARYINHSCNPNCVAEIVEVDRDLRIIIFAKRRIQRGEELAYDYKFDIEDDQHKISCMCGAPNCKKWMN